MRLIILASLLVAASCYRPRYHYYPDYEIEDNNDDRQPIRKHYGNVRSQPFRYSSEDEDEEAKAEFYERQQIDRPPRDHKTRDSIPNRKDYEVHDVEDENEYRSEGDADFIPPHHNPISDEPIERSVRRPVANDEMIRTGKEMETELTAPVSEDESSKKGDVIETKVSAPIANDDLSKSDEALESEITVPIVKDEPSKNSAVVETEVKAAVKDEPLMKNKVAAEAQIKDPVVEDELKSNDAESQAKLNEEFSDSSDEEQDMTEDLDIDSIDSQSSDSELVKDEPADSPVADNRESADRRYARIQRLRDMEKRERFYRLQRNKRPDSDVRIIKIHETAQRDHPERYNLRAYQRYEDERSQEDDVKSKEPSKPIYDDLFDDIDDSGSSVKDLVKDPIRNTVPVQPRRNDGGRQNTGVHMQGGRRDNRFDSLYDEENDFANSHRRHHSRFDMAKRRMADSPRRNEDHKRVPEYTRKDEEEFNGF